MDVDRYHCLIEQIREQKGIIYGFSVCLIAQLLHDGKEPEEYLPEICEKAEVITRESIGLEDRERVLNELRDFEERLGMDKLVSFLCADTDKVKSYVFESAKLPEVRGASIILDELNTKALKQQIFNGEGENLPAECLIYNSGGGVMAIVPTFMAEDIRKRIEGLYLANTQVATITAITESFHLYEYCLGLNADGFDFTTFQEKWSNAPAMQKRMMAHYYVPTDGGNLEDAFCETKGFGELVRHMSWKMQKAKRNKSFVPKIEAGKLLRNCDSCEFRAASCIDAFEDETDYLCTVCMTKREKGRQEKGQIIETKRTPPKDLVEIGESSRPEGFVGLIYADGDNVGKRLESLRTPLEYQEFSAKMDKVTREAVSGSITAEKLPSEIISAGGDDLVLFVPAHRALDIACDICDRFSEEMRKDGITMSAGVIIAADHYPVYYLFELAEQLLKSAKKESRKAEGGIDFMVLGSQNTLSSDIGNYRENFLQKTMEDSTKRVKEKLHLTERPYKVSELKKLLKWVKEFKGKNYPASQLYGIAQTLGQHSRQHSTLRFLYQLQRHEASDRRLLRGFMDDWGIEPPYPPWTKLKSDMPYDEFSSVFVDMVEIHKFVRIREE